MINKQHAKRGAGGHKSIGVADYFAVLGMDSFLPTAASSSATSSLCDDGDDGDADGSVTESDIDSGGHICPSDEGDSDSNRNDLREDSNGNTGDGNDGRNDVAKNGSSMSNGNHDCISLPLSNIEKHEESVASTLDGVTPRNNNLSRKPSKSGSASPFPNTTTTNAPPIQEKATDQEKGEEEKMLQERFEREIVKLALVSPPFDLDEKKWTYLPVDPSENNGSKGVLSPRGKLTSQKLDNLRIHIAFQRRGHMMDCGDDDENQLSSQDTQCNNADKQKIRTRQYDYFTPAVADVAICYAKLKLSTVPFFSDDGPRHSNWTDGLNSQQNNHQSNQPNERSQNSQFPKSRPGSAVAEAAAQAAAQRAKQLSSLARRTGLAAAGKEMAEGLANAVNVGRSINIPRSVVGRNSYHGSNQNEGQKFGGNTVQHGDGLSRRLLSRGTSGETRHDCRASFKDVNAEVPLWRTSSSIIDTVSSAGDDEYDDDDNDYHLNSCMKSSADAADSLTTPVGLKRVDRGTRQHFFPDTPLHSASFDKTGNRAFDIHDNECDIDAHVNDGIVKKSLEELLQLPDGYDEWAVPNFCHSIHLPTPELLRRRRLQQENAVKARSSSHRQPILVDRTHSIPSPFSRNSSGATSSSFLDRASPSSMGVEAMYLSPMSSSPHPEGRVTPCNNLNRGNRYLGLDTSTSQATSSVSSNSQSGHGTSPMTPQIQEPSDPRYLPSLVSWRALPPISSKGKISLPLNNGQNDATNDDLDDIYIPVLAIRRQRTEEKERFHEDPAVVNIQLSFLDSNGTPLLPKSLLENEEDEDDDEPGRGSIIMMQNGAHPNILKTSKWVPSSVTLPPSRPPPNNSSSQHSSPGATANPVFPSPSHLLQGLPLLFLQHNIPNGFADLPFPARVLDRFPRKNYRGMPFPEEELPMFCYPKGGSCLVRDKFRNLPLPKCFGFVVKNERGDSIYVSCLSFLEPLAKQRRRQLDRLSRRRRRTSLPHRFYWDRKRERRNRNHNKLYLLGFDDIITFENKTICLVGRYPYWTEFRRFLTHLHLLSGSSSDIPLERNISHLLLSVPVPKPGGQCVLVPLPTMNEPMALMMPPLKDLPLVDLPYQRLFAALDVPTVVTIVLGFLCLEKKVILVSTRQSLVLDCCELLKSLLFPFELCAPYVPHLTEPFMSCLEFPGATFVGIYDDGQTDGLASTVRKNIPEDSIIVDLDIGEIDCDGDRYEVLKAAYQIIPAESRSVLISEIETLCRDAGIIPGQEPLDFGIDSAIDSFFPSNAAEIFGKQSDTHREPLDDRAIRDNFLRFFCSILGGYERFLVVPDADFLISGNDWFDSAKFLSAAPPERKPFLNTLVETQLFQSFIQRRTEASDVHCMLFDECLVEYHSSNIPYGRLGGDVESRLYPDGDGRHHLVYNLLVDQCATEPDLLLEDDDISFLARSEGNEKGSGNDYDAATQASSGCASHNESTISENFGRVGDNFSFDADTPYALNASGDIVTIPSTANLPPNPRYLYCADGNPYFPTCLNRDLFFPKEPEFLATDFSEIPAPILTRSEREREEANRLCNMAVSRRGPQRQHRCLWQLPKFMGSQFFGAWLMCIPNQISQSNLSINQKSKILLRALGALRTLRSHRRIVADEAAYRALIVACGRCGTDRRVELMKLYGLMRTDGIFPNAVTLGQYTRAIAEGFSKRSTDANDDCRNKVGMQVIASPESNIIQKPLDLSDLDANLSSLEESGLRWRSRGNWSQPPSGTQTTTGIDRTASKDEQDQNQVISQAKTFDTFGTQKSSKTKRLWLPLSCSSSFLPPPVSEPIDGSSEKIPCSENTTRLFALWSRATICESCNYIPLDEEIQCGWDVVNNRNENSFTILCPRCGSMILPLIGYKEVSVKEALGSQMEDSNDGSAVKGKIFEDVITQARNSSLGTDLGAMPLVNMGNARTPKTPSENTYSTLDPDQQDVPPQLESIIREGDASLFPNEHGSTGFVTYISPQKLRLMLEQLVFEFGEEVLERDRLRSLDPQVFFNLWWYSARLSLPLPLAIAPSTIIDESGPDFGLSTSESDKKAGYTPDWCAFASWEKIVSIQGCQSAAKAITAAQSVPFTTENNLRGKLVDNPNADMPLLAYFNLQNYAQGDWDHPDLSEILVTLVQACETRDLFPVVECVFRRNALRQEEREESSRTTAVNYGMNRGVGCSPLDVSFESTGTSLFSLGGSAEASFNPMNAELDCYRTLLYLARYQCTTAFHAFFPTVTKACKGYHFWCAQGTPLPIFDRAFREAAEEYGRKNKRIVPIPDVSDVALGFRCVFGHII